jgi:hypothetical protein
MFWIKDAFATVWNVNKVEEKYTKIRIGTSEKDPKNPGKYINSNWFATFVGKAHEKAESLEPKDRIKILTGKVTNVGTKQDDGKWTSYLDVVVFDFEKRGETKPEDADMPPAIAGDSGDLPF